MSGHNAEHRQTVAAADVLTGLHGMSYDYYDVDNADIVYS